MFCMKAGIKGERARKERERSECKLSKLVLSNNPVMTWRVRRVISVSVSVDRAMRGRSRRVSPLLERASGQPSGLAIKEASMARKKKTRGRVRGERWKVIFSPFNKR